MFHLHGNGQEALRAVAGRVRIVQHGREREKSRGTALPGLHTAAFTCCDELTLSSLDVGCDRARRARRRRRASSTAPAATKPAPQQAPTAIPAVAALLSPLPLGCPSGTTVLM